MQWNWKNWNEKQRLTKFDQNWKLFCSFCLRFHPIENFFNCEKSETELPKKFSILIKFKNLQGRGRALIFLSIWSNRIQNKQNIFYFDQIGDLRARYRASLRRQSILPYNPYWILIGIRTIGPWGTPSIELNDLQL